MHWYESFYLCFSLDVGFWKIINWRLCHVCGIFFKKILSSIWIWLLAREAHTSIPIFKEQANEVVLAISRFITSCSAAQIRLAPDKCTELIQSISWIIFFLGMCMWWVSLYLLFFCVCVSVVVTVSKRLKEQVMVLERPIQGIAPLRLAIRKLQPSTEHLTALHPDYLLLCLLAKCYKAGLNILEDEIYEVDQPKDFFLYCYYGWVIYFYRVLFKDHLAFKNGLSEPVTSYIAHSHWKHEKLTSRLIFIDN